MKNVIPKVSILVPIYNVEKYLDECLASIINQTLKDIEIICINDGSTDNSLDIIKKYMKNDSRIKLIDKPNSGYGDSMNQGLNMASGEYIGIVESDDIAKKKMFKTLYSIAKKSNFPDIIKSNFFFYWGTTNDVQFVEHLPKKLCGYIFNPLKDQEIFKYAPMVWSAIYKKDLLEKYSINFLPTQGASYQDISFNFKTLYFATSMYCTYNGLIKYRRDNANSSVNNKEKVFCVNGEYKEIEKIVYDDTTIKPILLVMKFDSYLWNYNRVDIQYKDIFLEKFKEEFLKDKEFIKPKLFKKRNYILLMKLLDGIDEFKDEENRRKTKHLKTTTEKLFSKIKQYKKQHFILYGFNDIAKDILEKDTFQISFILDRNPQQEQFNDIPIYNINNIEQPYNDEIFIITAFNPKFIEEIKKTILEKFTKAKIISI